jgi:hypothetical protein
LLHFEVANVCLKKMCGHPERRDALATAFGMLEQMEVGVAEVDHGEVSPNGSVLPRTTPATCGLRAGRERSW